MATKYEAASGSRLSDDDAAKYGSRINWLTERNGFVTPELVVEDAKKPNSPLHDYFDWNEKKAAEKWRIEQAQYLIRNIVVTIVSDEKPETIRQFYSVTPSKDMETEAPKVYVTLNSVMSNDAQRREVIAYALRELIGWTKRYGQYSEFGRLISIIQEEVIKVHA